MLNTGQKNTIRGRVQKKYISELNEKGTESEDQWNSKSLFDNGQEGNLIKSRVDSEKDETLS